MSIVIYNQCFLDVSRKKKMKNDSTYGWYNSLAALNIVLKKSYNSVNATEIVFNILILNIVLTMYQKVANMQ